MISLILRTSNLLEHLALEVIVDDLEQDLNAKACVSREFTDAGTRAFIVIYGQQSAEMLIALQQAFPLATNVNTKHPSLLNLPRFAPMNIVRKAHLHTLPPSVLQPALQAA
jgi:hypothetical protein